MTLKKGENKNLDTFLGDTQCQFCGQYMGNADPEEWFLLGTGSCCTRKNCIEKSKARWVEAVITNA